MYFFFNAISNEQIEVFSNELNNYKDLHIFSGKMTAKSIAN